MADTAYATLVEFQARCNDSSATYLQQMLNAAARLVDKNTRGVLEGYEAFSTSASETRYFDDYLDGRDAPIDDSQGPTAVTRGGIAVTSTYYDFKPYQKGEACYTIIIFRPDAPAPANNTWYKGGIGRKQLAITGTWGYCSSSKRPAEIKEATLLQAVRMYERQNLSQADVVSMVSNPFRDLDPFVREMLAPFVKWGRPVLA